MRVIVVGAGLAGLAATCASPTAGREVVLVERSRLRRRQGDLVHRRRRRGRQRPARPPRLLHRVPRLRRARWGMSGSLWTPAAFRGDRAAPRRPPEPAARDARPARARCSLLPSFAALRAAGPARQGPGGARAAPRSPRPPRPGETFAALAAPPRPGARRAATASGSSSSSPRSTPRLDEVSAADALFVVRTAFAGDPDAARIGWSRVPLARIAEAAAARASAVRLRTARRGAPRRRRRGARGALQRWRGDPRPTPWCSRCHRPASPPSSASPARYGVTGLDRIPLARHRRRPPLVRRRAPASTSRRSSARRCSGCSRSSPATSAAASAPPTRWSGWPEAELVELCHARAGRGVAARCAPRAWCAAPRPATPRPPSSPRPGCAAPGRATARANLAIAGAWTATGWPATMESAVRSGRARPPTCSPTAPASWPARRWRRRVADTLQRAPRTASCPGTRAARRRRRRPPARPARTRAGWWSGELETNVTMTAEHVLLLAFLGLSHDGIRDGAIRHLLGCQREDGSWGLYHDAPADLSTTIEAYVALRVLGLDSRTPRAAARAARHPRAGRRRPRARLHQDLAGALRRLSRGRACRACRRSWCGCRRRVPLNLYDFACWARGTIAPAAHRHLAAAAAPSALLARRAGAAGHRVAAAPRRGHGPFAWADRLQKQYDTPARPARPRRVATPAGGLDPRAPGGRRRAGAASSHRGCTR